LSQHFRVLSQTFPTYRVASAKSAMWGFFFVIWRILIPWLELFTGEKSVWE
jgi:hypothetical protein